MGCDSGAHCLHASTPALLVMAASPHDVTSSVERTRVPHGFSQCEQVRMSAAKEQPAHDVA